MFTLEEHVKAQVCLSEEHSDEVSSCAFTCDDITQERWNRDEYKIEIVDMGNTIH